MEEGNRLNSKKVVPETGLRSQTVTSSVFGCDIEVSCEEQPPKIARAPLQHQHASRTRRVTLFLFLRWRVGGFGDGLAGWVGGRAGGSIGMHVGECFRACGWWRCHFFSGDLFFVRCTGPPLAYFSVPLVDCYCCSIGHMRQATCPGIWGVCIRVFVSCDL